MIKDRRMIKTGIQCRCCRGITDNKTELSPTADHEIQYEETMWDRQVDLDSPAQGMRTQENPYCPNCGLVYSYAWVKIQIWERDVNKELKEKEARDE